MLLAAAAAALADATAEAKAGFNELYQAWLAANAAIDGVNPVRADIAATTEEGADEVAIETGDDDITLELDVGASDEAGATPDDVEDEGDVDAGIDCM